MTVSRDELVERFRQMAEILRKLDSSDAVLDDLARLQSAALCAWDDKQTRHTTKQQSRLQREGEQAEGFIHVTSTTRWR